MFDVENGHYEKITVNQKGSLQIVEAHLKNEPRYCLKPQEPGCRKTAPYSQDGDTSTPHILYGLYDRNNRKPAEFRIFRKRYECQVCGATFYGDADNPDFGEHDKSLPEFIKYLIKEWLEDGNITFTSLGAKYSQSKATISGWCGQLVEAFDSKTKSNTRKAMYFSSFRYGKKDPRIHCAIYTIIRQKAVICGIIDDYTDTENLEDKIRARLDRLSVAEEVFYDYYPGVNKVIQAVFPNARIQIWDESFEEELRCRIVGLDRTYIDNMRKLVGFGLGSQYVTYQEWFENFDRWINTLPEQNQKEIAEFFAPLKNDTPKHIVNIWGGNPTDDFSHLTSELDGISGNVPYENFKLRLLYDSSLFAEKIEESLKNLVIKNKQSKKKDDGILSEIQMYMLQADKTLAEMELNGRVSHVKKTLKGVKPITEQSPKHSACSLSAGKGAADNPIIDEHQPQYSSHQEERPESPTAYVINFFEAFQCLDPNDMFDIMPPIRGWHVPVEYVYEVLDEEEENNAWLDLDE